MTNEQAREKLLLAIEVLASKITVLTKADEALKFTQAALNAANTIRCLDDTRVTSY
ncbi:MAG: hypothetical protein IMF19_00860 [Proteobacteria bacterium]|nr:hypothetical protein [Pseudomonadota bacterium]